MVWENFAADRPSLSLRIFGRNVRCNITGTLIIVYGKTMIEKLQLHHVL